MEAHIIKGEAKSCTLPNGAVITNAERGEENKEIMITSLILSPYFYACNRRIGKTLPCLCCDYAF